MSDTYEIPKHGWTCFFCGETFRTVGGARDHFGATEDSIPGCQIRVQLGDERGLQMALRKAEVELARYRAEDSDKDREMHTIRAGHERALRQAEELGYERGLRDAVQKGIKPAS